MNNGMGNMFNMGNMGNMGMGGGGGGWGWCVFLLVMIGFFNISLVVDDSHVVDDPNHHADVHRTDVVLVEETHVVVHLIVNHVVDRNFN